MPETDRAALRIALRAARRALSARQRLTAAYAVAANLRGSLPALGHDIRVAGYWACDGELPLHPLLAGPYPFHYLLPRLLEGKRLGFVPWRPGEPVQPNRYGIPEPTSDRTVPAARIDIVLLPLLGFDRHGNRLGSGGGYYDRTFAFIRDAAPAQRPLLVGIGYAMQEVAALDRAAWDVPLDRVVTEDEVIECLADPGS